MSNDRPSQKYSPIEPTESKDLVHVAKEGSPTFPKRDVCSTRASESGTSVKVTLQELNTKKNIESLPNLMHKVEIGDKNVFPPVEFTGLSTGTGTPVDNFDDNSEIEQSEDQISPDTSPTKTVASAHVKLRRTSSSLSVRTLTLPKVNCPEKIFLCIDHSAEMFQNKFQSNSSNQSSVFQTLTNVIKQFICTKSFFNKKHQFALVMLNDDAQFITDFSSNYEELLFMLKTIADTPPQGMNEQENETSFDLSNIFNVIKQQAGLPRINMKQAAKMPPPYIVRVIFVYGRSNIGLKFLSSQKNFILLNNSPFFFFDGVYIHETATENNNIEKNFSDICALDTRGTSHIYEVGTDSNMACLYNIFAKLLAHPLQRPKQSEGVISYKLEDE